MPARGPAARSGPGREVLVQAAVELLREGGPAAVTMRGVAARAGLSLGSATYWFPDSSRLVAAAVGVAAAGHVDAARERAERPLEPGAEALARRLVELAADPRGDSGREAVRARYERTLAAVASPELAGSVAEADAGVTAVVARLLERMGRDPSAARAVLALADGVVLAQLLSHADDVLGGAAGALAPHLDALAPRRGSSTDGGEA